MPEYDEPSPFEPGPDALLDAHVVEGEPAHWEKHTNANKQVNWLTEAFADDAAFGVRVNTHRIEQPTLVRRIPGLNWLYPMQAGHGWAAGGTGIVSNLNDGADPGLGTQSITLTTNGAAAIDAALTKVTGGIDMTGKGLALMIKVDAAGPEKVGAIAVDVGPNGLASFWRAYIFANAIAEREEIQLGEWTRIMIPWSRFEALKSGAPNRAAIGAIRLVAVDAGAGAITVHLGGVGTYSEGTIYSGGVVSFSLDDCYDEHYASLLPLLNVKGFRATVYPIVSRLDTAGYMTTAQIKRLAKTYGWEVAGHAATEAAHVDLTAGARTDDQITADMVAMREWQRDLGLPPSTFAYPAGRFNIAVEAAVRRFYGAAASNAAREMSPVNVNATRLYRVGLTPATTLVEAKALVDRAKASGGWVVFMAHDVVAAAPSGTGWLLADFSALVDYIAAQAVPVAPVRDVLNALPASGS